MQWCNAQNIVESFETFKKILL